MERYDSIKVSLYPFISNIFKYSQSDKLPYLQIRTSR